VAVFIQNRIFNRARNGLPESPYKLWYGHKPNLNYIRTFGCLSFIQNQDNKFSPTSQKGFLAGFDEFNCNYLIFDYETQKFINTHDVHFNEKISPERGNKDPNPFNIEQEEMCKSRETEHNETN
jgi:hypothetical protein